VTAFASLNGERSRSHLAERVLATSSQPGSHAASPTDDSRRQPSYGYQVARAESPKPDQCHRDRPAGPMYLTGASRLQLPRHRRVFGVATTRRSSTLSRRSPRQMKERRQIYEQVTSCCSSCGPAHDDTARTGTSPPACEHDASAWDHPPCPQDRACRAARDGRPPLAPTGGYHMRR